MYECQRNGFPLRGPDTAQWVYQLSTPIANQIQLDEWIEAYTMYIYTKVQTSSLHHSVDTIDEKMIGQNGQFLTVFWHIFISISLASYSIYIILYIIR